MENNNQYYTPDLEDLFVGYECEGNTFTNDGFKPFKVESIFGMFPILRTPYLTKEDIEKEGWKFVWWESMVNIFEKDNLVLTLSVFADDKGKIKINYKTGYQLFDGQCKSINEFRKICKWLNIK